MPKLVAEYQASGEEATLEEAIRKIEAAKSATPENVRRHFKEVVRWLPLGQIGHSWAWKLKGWTGA